MSSLRGPRARQVRRKTFLYPKEAARMLSCGGIEIEWREVYAIALYTYLRPGELGVLTVGDVDLDARHIHVTHLGAAQVTSVELHKSTRTHMQSNVHSCRDSGITWLAMQGADVATIQRRARHAPSTPRWAT